MAALRSQFIHRASGLAKLLPFPLLMRLAGQRFLVLLYHAVSDDSPVHIRHLYQLKTTQEFSDDLDFLLRHLQPIDIFALRDHVSGQKRLDRPSFLISFDDGLREFGEVAAPILQRKGVPAVCFLNSDFVGNKALFFRYKASLLLEELQGREGEKGVKEWLEKQEREGKTLRETVLGIRHGQTALLEALARGIGLDFSEYLQHAQPYLNPEEIRKLQADGFHFGAHSVDHPEYQYLPQTEQLRQTRASQDAVQLQFGVDERWFAFPFTDFGLSSTFFSELYADRPPPELTFGCAGLKKESIPRHVQRIPLEMGGLGASRILPAELLYYLLKAPLGKNRMQRP